MNAVAPQQEPEDSGNALPQGQNPAALTPPPEAEPVPVELGLRPMDAPNLNNTAELGAKLGVTNDQLDAATGKLNENFANAMRAVLNGNTSGVDINLIASIDKEKSKQRIMMKTLRAYLLNMTNAARPYSKELKGLIKAVKKSKSLIDMVNTMAAYPQSNPDFDLVNMIFANSMSLLLYGQGNLQADATKKFLKQVTLSDNGEQKPLKPYLDALIGDPVSQFNAQNSNPEEALAARITADIMLQAPMIAGLDMAAVLKDMTKNKPASQEGMSDQDKKGLGGINTFIESIKISSAELRKASNKNMLQQARTDRSKEAKRSAEAKLSDLRTEQERFTGQIKVSERDIAKTTRDLNTANAPGSTITSNEKAALSESISSMQAILDESKAALNAINRKIEVLDSAVGHFEADLGTYADQAFTAKEDTVLKSDEILAGLEQVVSFIKFKLENMKSSGKELDMAIYPTLSGLMQLLEDNAVDQKDVLAQKLITFLSESNKLGLVKNLTDIQLSLTDTRNYTPEEYSLTLLTEFYQKQSPDITRDTAKLMAVSHYIRMQKEKRLQGFRERLINKRGSESLRGVEKVSADKLIKLVAKDKTGVLRDPSVPVEGSLEAAPSELAALEGLSPDMSLPDLRQYLSENPASIDSLTFMMYNLVSYYIPRNLVDGQRLVLKDPKEIARIEKLVNILNQYISENAALNILNSAKEISGKNAENSEAMNLAEALKLYQDEYDAREQNIVIAAGSKKSKALSKKSFKEMRKILLKQAKEENWTKDELHEQVRNAGIDGIGDKGITARHYKNNVIGGGVALAKGFSKFTGLTALGHGSVNLVKKGGKLFYESRGKIAKIVTAPIWVGPYLLYKVTKGVGKTAKYVIMNPGKTVAGVVATAGALVTLPIGIPVGIAKSAYEGAKEGVQSMRKRGENTINGVTGAMHNAIVHGEFPWTKDKDGKHGDPSAGGK